VLARMETIREAEMAAGYTSHRLQDATVLLYFDSKFFTSLADSVMVGVQLNVRFRPRFDFASVHEMHDSSAAQISIVELKLVCYR
jgi:hypothetical protein